MLDAFLDALIDTLKILPFLFAAYLAMEYLESHTEDRIRRFVKRAGWMGPFWGGILGAVPQCGFSAAASNLYAGRAVSLGTLIAIFLSTSDEMLPIMLSSIRETSGLGLGRILGIVAAKAGCGIVLGYLADFLFGRFFARKNIHSFCEREHCECEEEEGSALHSALIHTLKIAGMLIVVTFLLNLILANVEPEKLSGTILAQPVLGAMLLALLGLIPNCSVSVILTRAFLSGIIGLGGLFAGLLSNAGIGMLVLFRSNRDMRENFAVVGISYVFSALTGILIGLLL